MVVASLDHGKVSGGRLVQAVEPGAPRCPIGLDLASLGLVEVLEAQLAWSLVESLAEAAAQVERHRLDPGDLVDAPRLQGPLDRSPAHLRSLRDVTLHGLDQAGPGGDQALAGGRGARMAGVGLECRLHGQADVIEPALL